MENFKIVNGILLKYKGNESHVVIPDGVTEISTDAFNGCTSMTTIKIPKSVISISCNAFEGCVNPMNIEISNSVKYIGFNAFGFYAQPKRQYNANGSLRAFKAFRRDWSCRSFQYEVGKSYHQDGIIRCCENGFHASTNPLDVFKYFDGKLNELRFAEVELSGKMHWCIGHVAASDIKILRELTWQDLVRIYNSMANTIMKGMKFKDGSLLRYKGNHSHVVIPDIVTCIGIEAFWGCSNLKSITIPNSVTEIGNAAFRDCSNLTNIELPNSVTSIDTLAFDGCTSLTSIEIPSGVTRIAHYAFSDCSNLKSIKFPNKVTCIDEGAFKGCTSLSYFKIPNSVSYIGYNAFDGIKKVKPQYNVNGTLRAFKGFNKDWTCYRDFQYSVGKSYHQDGKIECRSKGFHACANPLDVFNYYYGQVTKLRFAEVELSGEMDWNGDMVTASDIKIVRELTVSELAEIYKSMANDKMEDKDIVNDLSENTETVSFDYTTVYGKPIEIWYAKVKEHVFDLNSGQYHVVTDSWPTLFGPLKTLHIHGLSYVPESAFKEKETLEKVVLDKACKSIHAEAFKDCSNLKEVVVEGELEYIGNNAFEGTPLVNVGTHIFKRNEVPMFKMEKMYPLPKITIFYPNGEKCCIIHHTDELNHYLAQIAKNNIEGMTCKVEKRDELGHVIMTNIYNILADGRIENGHDIFEEDDANMKIIMGF